jgi:hypothetical protein
MPIALSQAFIAAKRIRGVDGKGTLPGIRLSRMWELAARTSPDEGDVVWLAFPRWDEIQKSYHQIFFHEERVHV